MRRGQVTPAYRDPGGERSVFIAAGKPVVGDIETYPFDFDGIFGIGEADVGLRAREPHSVVAHLETAKHADKSEAKHNTGNIAACGSLDGTNKGGQRRQSCAL